jgi:hypothetical protein
VQWEETIVRCEFEGDVLAVCWLQADSDVEHRQFCVLNFVVAFKLNTLFEASWKTSAGLTQRKLCEAPRRTGAGHCDGSKGMSVLPPS